VYKETKYTFAFCAVGNAGEKGIFDSVLNLKYLGTEVIMVAHSEVTVAP
jgi:hypothetical protein